MAILVDDLREFPHLSLPVKHWCHMASDASFDELHDFADRLGIPRHRFQGDHYDLPPALRARALALGAEHVKATELVTRMVGPRGDRVRERRARRRSGEDIPLGRRFDEVRRGEPGQQPSSIDRAQRVTSCASPRRRRPQAP